MNSPKKLSDYFSDYDFEKIKTVPKNSIFRLIFSRTCISLALIVLQFLFLAAVTFSWSEQHTEAILLIMIVLSACIFIVILNSERNPSYKIAWIIPVALLPCSVPSSFCCFTSISVPSLPRRMSGRR